MAVTLFCPICNVKVDVPDRLAGKSVPCPSCRNLIDIPLHDRTPAARRLLRRVLAAAPWLVAGGALAALLAETWYVAGLAASHRVLDAEIRAVKQRLAMREAPPLPAGPAPAPPAPSVAPPPPQPPVDSPGERAALQREIASLRDSLAALVQKLAGMEADLAGLKGSTAPPGPAAEAASDDEIETEVSVKADAAGPRLRFMFEGRAVNTSRKPAPAVRVVLHVSQFQGLHLLTSEAVTFIPHAAVMTERLGLLGPGESRNFWLEFSPTEPGLMRRDLNWMPQYTVGAKVGRE